MINTVRIILGFALFSSLTQAQLIQKKYPGLAGKPADNLFINNENAKIIPHNQYDTFLSQQVGIAHKPANIIANGKDQLTTYPYLIVPKSEYASYMKKHPGFAGKPANHIMLNGKETIILSSQEINTNMSLYPGIGNKPANHVLIDGQEVVFVDKEKYSGFVAQYPGVPELPSNYVYIDKKIVVVVPINSEDVADVHQFPFPTNVNNDSKSMMKTVPDNENGNKENTTNSSSTVTK